MSEAQAVYVSEVIHTDEDSHSHSWNIRCLILLMFLMEVQLFGH